MFVRNSGYLRLEYFCSKSTCKTSNLHSGIILIRLKHCHYLYLIRKKHLMIFFYSDYLDWRCTYSLLVGCYCTKVVTEKVAIITQRSYNLNIMDQFLSMISADQRVGGGDSFCDRLNSKMTVYLLLVMGIFLTTRQYLGGDPIACWVPAFFTGSHRDYTNKVCWTTNTYYLPFEEHHIPKEGAPRQMISYYQWVALILSCQAVMFYTPRPIWRLFNKKSGIAVSTITDAAIECQRKMDPESRDKVLRYMIKHMGRFLVELSRNHLMSTTCKQFWWALYGNYLIILYIVIKLVYIGNVIGQIALLNNFLGMSYHMYGFEVFRKMVQGEDWTTSDRFPRVTMCDFKIRVLGNIHRYTVQCSLPLNLFNEKIFIFIWFWFVFVGIATFGSLCLWIATSFYLPYQVRYIRSRLVAMDKLHHAKDDEVRKFVYNYLRRDGLFLIRLVAKNASDLVAAELICGLWEHFKDHRKQIERLESNDEVLSPNNLILTDRTDGASNGDSKA